MRKILLLALFAVALTATVASAIDWYGSPWWSRDLDGATFQEWWFGQGMLPAEADVWDNPYGVPFCEILGGEWEYSADWPGPEAIDPTVSGWHCYSPGGGKLVLTIPNWFMPNLYKIIFIQITSSKAPSGVSAAGHDAAGNAYAAGTWPSGLPQVQLGGPAPFGGSWYVYPFLLWIRPNPEWETIVIEVPECTVIEEIVVDTLCTDDESPTEPNTWGGVKTLFR